MYIGIDLGPTARITCICCTGWQTREEAQRIAAAANIPEVLDARRK